MDFSPSPRAAGLTARLAAFVADAITPVERRLLKRRSWVRDLWFRTGKPVYRFVTRKLLKWEDNEGQGPKP